jgi:hypothetical protein
MAQALLFCLARGEKHRCIRGVAAAVAFYGDYMVNFKKDNQKGKSDEKTKNSKKHGGTLANDPYAGRKKKRYLESIPEQVSSSMAFEGEKVSLKMLKEYLKTLKNIPQPHGS